MKNNAANDKVSALFNVAGGFGQIVSPILSGYLYDNYSFNTWMDIWAIIIISFNILYIVFCNGIQAFWQSLVLTWRRNSTNDSDTSSQNNGSYTDLSDVETVENTKLLIENNLSKKRFDEEEINEDSKIIHQVYTLNE